MLSHRLICGAKDLPRDNLNHFAKECPKRAQLDDVSMEKGVEDTTNPMCVLDD